MRHMRSRRILAMLLALSMIFGLLTTTAFAGEVDQNTSNVGESAANGTSEGGSGEGQSSGASEDESSKVTNKEDVPTEEETTPEEKKTTSSEEVDTQEGEGEQTVVGGANSVASIGETGYESLDAAIQAAQDNDTIVVSAGEYTLNGNLTYSGKAFTIKAADNETVSFDMSAAVALHGAKITFEGVTFDYKTNGNYIGLQHADTLVYNNCIINGKVFLYAGKETFNHCTFNQDSADYCVWTYGAAETTFNNCTFNCKGKAVLVYNEGYIKTVNVEVNNTTFAASETVDKKAAIELDTHLMKGASINVDNASTATGFSTNTTDGAGLWNAKRIDSENNETVEVVVGGEVKYTLSSAPVAMVNGVSYNKLEDAFAALSDEAYTLTLNDESAWDTATPVYWAAGEQSGYAATLAEALTKAYMQSAESIKIICRPDADVGTMTHGHAADNLTIYGNKAYISAGECDLEVDTFKFDRSTGRQATDGVTLDKDITITAYELDNLGVWGQRNTNHIVTINLTECDGKELEKNVQRVYLSGAKGTNNITLTDCKFITEKCPIYSNADGSVTVKGCTFTGVAEPINLKHKGTGTATYTVEGCTFTDCGSEAAADKAYAAPIRFVSDTAEGTVTATVSNCSFSGTIGQNGDILLGDGRPGEPEYDVALTVENTTAKVMAQKGGYYDADGNVTDTNKGATKEVSGETLTTSISALISGGESGNAIVDEKTLRKALFDAPTDGTQITIKLENDITLEMLYAAENFGTDKLDDDAAGDTFNRYKLGVHPTEDDPDHWNPLVTNQSQEARLLYGAYYHMSATDERIARLVVKAGQNIVLDLNGHTIQKNSRATHGDWSTTCTDILANYGTLTITDTSTGAKGTIKGNGYISCQGAVLHNYEGASMTVGAINVDGNAAGMSKGTGQYVVVNDGGTLSIDGANIFDTATSASLLVNTAGTMSVKNAMLSHPATKTFNVKGGTVEINEGVEITSDANAIFVKDGTVRLNATVSIKASSDGAAAGTLAIEGETAKVEKAEGVEMAAPAGYKWENNVLVKDVAANDGSKEHPYTLKELGEMTRDAYIAAQKELNGTMYVTVGDYSYDTDGVLGNGTANNSDRDSTKLNYYGAPGAKSGQYSDEAVGKNVVFVGSSITSGVKGYTSIDNIGTSLLLAVPAYTNVTFKDITFNNVMSFNYQLYTSPWSQLGELKFDGCTFNGIIVGATAAQTLTFNGCTFTNFTNTTDANSSNPTWIRPAYGNWTSGDNEGQGSDFRSLTTINFTNNKVTSTRPVKFEYVSQWDVTTTIKVDGNKFDISKQDNDGTNVKNVGMYFGSHTNENAFNLILGTNEKSDNTAALYTLKKNQTSLPAGSTVTDLSGKQIEITDALEWKTENQITLKTEPVPAVKNVAKVGETEYATLEEAIAKAEAGQTVTLIADVNTPETTYVVSKNLTIDLNGKTVTGYGYDGVFQIDGKDAKVLIKNGNVVAVEQSGTAGKYAMAVWACAENCVVTLEDLTVTQDITHTDDKQMDMIYTSKGTIIINSGSFTSGTPAWTLNCKDAAFKDGSAKIIVNGGTFTGFDPCNNAAEGRGTSFVAEGVGVDYDENGSFTAKAGMVAQVLEATGSSVKAFATLDEAFNAVIEGQTVRLLKDLTEDVTINKNITLDLGGKTLTNAGAGKATITNNGTVTITDSSTAKTGTIKRDDNGTVGETSFYVIRNIGTMTIEQAIVTNNSGYRQTNPSGSMNGSSLICNGDDDLGGTLNISGGKFEQRNFIAIKNGALGKLNVTGGTISSDHSAIQNWFEATITGGEINGQLWTDAYIKDESVGHTTIGGSAKYTGEIVMDIYGSVKPELEISGGDLNVTNWRITTAAAKAGAKPAVSGGKFTSAVPENYCADGYVPTKNEDGTYGVKVDDSVAEVGGVKYLSLQEAINAAPKGQTVKLLNDTKENVTIAKALTLDLNGKTLNGSTGERKPALTVTARGVTVKDSSADMSGTIMREDTADNSGVSSHYVIDVQGAGWLTFESGNVINNSGNSAGKGASLVRVGDDSVEKYPGLNIKGGNFQQDNFIAIKVDRGDLFLNGGTITSENSYAIENWLRTTIKGGTVNGTVSTWVYKDGNSVNDLEISGGTINGNVASVTYDKAEGKTAKVTISGGTVTGTLGTYSYNNGLDPIEEPAKATIGVTGGTFSKNPTKYVLEGSSVTTNSDGTFGVEKAPIAKVGETSYYTMDEAFHAAVASGETLYLLRDYTTNSEQKSGSNSFTIDLNGYTWTYTGTNTNCAAFEINYPNVTLTVKNGKVVSNSMVGLIPSAMGGTITYDSSGLVFEKVEATANGHSGIETNGNNTNDTVTLKNSTLNVPNGFGIYFPSSGKLTIDNSKITAKTLGVQVCSGSLDIKGADTKIEVTGDPVPKTENDGAIQDGAAISIVNRTGYKGLGTITVTEGTFKAKSGNAAVKAYNWANQAESDFTESNKVAISGGTFSSAVAPEYCAEGFEPKDNGDGTYGVQPDGNIAEIGSVKYTSLDDALKAAKDGETVKLLKDAELEEVVIRSGRTLDLNGHTLKADYVTYFGGNLVDNSAAHTGLLKVLSADEILFTKNKKIDAMTQIPIYSLEKQGYVFEEIVLRVAPVTNKTPSALQAVYRPRQKDGTSDLSDAQKAMFGSANGHPVTATFRLVYKYKNSNEVQTFEFDFVDTYMDIYLNQNLYMYVTVTGLDIENIETITVTPVLKSAGGQVELVGKTIDTAAVLANLIGQ